ncbi:NUDIX domain-containing protein [Photobacterium sp. R1]
MTGREKVTLHYSSRALIQVQDKILLVRRVGDRMSFLPGGHVELGEAAAKALAREIEEETGMKARVGSLIGVAENDWLESGQQQAEIALVFQAELAGVCEAMQIDSKEAHLEFFWAEIRALDEHQLYPVALRELIREGMSHYQGFVASDLDK